MKVEVKVEVGARQVGFRHLPVPMAAPRWEKPASMARWLALVAALEMGLPLERAMCQEMYQAMGATAVGADAQAGRAARVIPVTLEMASAPVGRLPMTRAVAKGTRKCRGRDRARGAAEPGLTVALKMTVETVRAQMRSPTR